MTVKYCDMIKKEHTKSFTLYAKKLLFHFLGQPKKLLVKNCRASYLLQICFVRSFELETHYKQIIFLQLFGVFCSEAPTTQLTKNVGKALRLRFQRLLGHPISSEKWKLFSDTCTCASVCVSACVCVCACVHECVADMDKECWRERERIRMTQKARETEKREGRT